MTKLLLSACLLGQKVRFDGRDNLLAHPVLQELIESGKVISICPEMAGGLPTPRPPAEIEFGKSAQDVFNQTAKILTNSGVDVTQEYLNGAYKTLELAQKHHVKVAILKARSPSCGSKQIYDGSYSRKVIDGMGITAALLIKHGIQIFDETELNKAIELFIKNYG